jgi:hypothetical protein
MVLSVFILWLGVTANQRPLQTGYRGETLCGLDKFHAKFAVNLSGSRYISRYSLHLGSPTTPICAAGRRRPFNRGAPRAKWRQLGPINAKLLIYA